MPSSTPHPTTIDVPSSIHSTNEEPLFLQSDDEEVSHPHQSGVEEEIQRKYAWLRTLLAENEGRTWNTAYRDFVEVRLLLFAIQGMGMEEMRGNRIRNGVFQTSTGEVSLSVWDFIDILQLKHSSGTWRNKVNTYFRIKELYLFAQYKGGEMPFQSPEHCQAWEVVRIWMERQEVMLGDNDWVTRRYGTKELRLLLQCMVEEIRHGELVPSLLHTYTKY